MDKTSVVDEQFRFMKIVEENYAKYIHKDSVILEIGCFKGYSLKEMKKFTENEKIYGIDLSDGAVNFAKKHTGLNQIYNTDAFHFLKEKEVFFDVIIMKAVLEHIEKHKVDKLIELMHKSLKKGGVALISVPNMAWIMSSHERYMDFTHQVGFTVESLYDVNRAHFKSVTVLPMKYDFPISLKGKIRKKIFTPVVQKFVSLIYKLLGQGAYVPSMFDRSILAVCYK